MKLTAQQTKEMKSQLAEGFHTAFRKASDHPTANKIWHLIKEMPDGEYGKVIDFVVWGVFR